MSSSLSLLKSILSLNVHLTSRLMITFYSFEILSVLLIKNFFVKLEWQFYSIKYILKSSQEIRLHKIYLIILNR